MRATPPATDLATLLAAMAPRLSSQIHTFATTRDRAMPDRIRPIAVFEEDEGLTLICPIREARRLALEHEGRFRRITLTVHSSLTAVGFVAAVSAALAGEGISCNVVSAFHHDHLFVPADEAKRALRVLQDLSVRSSAQAMRLAPATARKDPSRVAKREPRP